jgi:O-antigen/teichoic acid export membrane protein
VDRRRHDAQSKSERVKIDISFNFVAAVWTAVITLIFTPVYVHYLGIEAYGLIGLLATLQASLGVFDLGLSQVLARELARFTGGGISEQSVRNLIRSIETITLVVAVAVVLAIGLSAGWIGRSWLQPDKMAVSGLVYAIGLMGVLVGLRLFEGLYRGGATGLHRQVQLNVVTMGCVTLRAAGALLLLMFISRSIVVFFVWQAVVSVLNVFLLRWVIYASLANPQLHGHFSLTEVKQVARFAAGVTCIAILGIALTQADKLLLSRLLPLKDFGEYILAVTLAAAPLAFVVPISQAAQPRFARAVATGENATLAHLFHGSSQLVTVIAGSAAVVIMCFSRDVLDLWLHNPDLAERLTPLVRTLALGSLLNILLLLPYILQLAYGWTGLGARVNLAAVMILVPGLLFIVPRYGAIGAAWLWVALNTGYATIALHFMFRRVLPDHKWRWYGSDVIQPLLAAAAMAMLMQTAFPSGGSFFLRLAALAFASVATLSAAAVAAPIIRGEVISFVLNARWRNALGDV